MNPRKGHLRLFLYLAALLAQKLAVAKLKAKLTGSVSVANEARRLIDFGAAPTALYVISTTWCEPGNMHTTPEASTEL